MDEKLEKQWRQWYEEIPSEDESEHDPYSTDDSIADPEYTQPDSYSSDQSNELSPKYDDLKGLPEDVVVVLPKLPVGLWLIQYVQRRATQLIDGPVLTCHLRRPSYRRAICDPSLFCRYSNGFCSSELAL
nr:unnamed protein product [Callosobruchus chinensis]